jgi:aminopeptidase YwaD
MNSLGPAAAVLVLVAFQAFSSGGQGTVGADPSGDNLRSRVSVLTDPSFAGRAAGTSEAAVAAETLAVWMEDLGLQPAFGGSWFQELPLSGKGWSGEDLNGKTGRNVAGILPGKGRLAGRYVVVGAHYDHLGRLALTDTSASAPARGDYYPGANDNASGVAVVHELIRLAQMTPSDSVARRSVMFVNFTAEEVGLQGSGFLVSHLPVAIDSVDAMINLDTVGQLNDNRLHVSGVGTTTAFAALVAAADAHDLDLSLAQGGWSGSDHMSFNTREVPVLFIFGGAYPQYNRPTDDWESLDYGALARVTAFASRLLSLVRTEPGELPWVMVAEKNLRQGDDEGANRATWLGTLPDFTEDVTGYKLAGVFDESPAAGAGLQKGDVLVMLGGSVIEDLATFTQALRSHGPGDLVEVRLLRDGRELNFTVVLGNRSDRK